MVSGVYIYACTSLLLVIDKKFLPFCDFVRE